MHCSNCQREIANYSNFCYYCGARQERATSAAAAGTQPRRLQRSLVDCKIGGVCGGIAEYMDTDPTIVRLVWAVVTFFTGIVPGCIAYLVAWLIMPPGPYPVIVQPSAPVAQAPAPDAPRA
ncbi:MAG TPA: PspC domain-containing protein [Candidatus Acidoferrales bacterium]|nr:PspC domain-containing protein [Candidatus Acidoferrales bacterium]